MDKDLGRRIDHLLVDIGQKRPWLSRETGIPLGTLNNWASKKQSKPKAENLYAVAKVLGTTVEYLLTGEKQDSQSDQWHSNDERKLINTYRDLPAVGKSVLLDTAESLRSNYSSSNKERLA